MDKKLKVLLISSLIWNFGDGMLGPLFAVFSQNVGGNILDVSSAWAIYLGVMGVLTIFVGKMSDRYSKEKIMIAGYLVTALFTFGYVFVTTPAMLFFVQAGLGVGIALCNPTWYALYSKYADESAAGYSWGLSDGLTHIVAALSIIVGGLIISYFSFKILFVIMGTLQLISAAYQAKIFLFEKHTS
ncbi:MAG TPA: MFS transporter [Candidatus Paceibacterota bacterium]|jgi:MFS family permease|nr:MFS transporter [Candidatus Paceibacterota bacterium]